MWLHINAFRFLYVSFAWKTIHMWPHAPAADFNLDFNTSIRACILWRLSY